MQLAKTSRIYNLAALLLLSLLLSPHFSTLAWAQDSPAEEQEENGEDHEKLFIPLGRYEKAVTNFDGVLDEEVVTYLKLTNDQGVVLPTMSTGTFNEPVDFTVMMWIKIDQDAIGDNELMYLFNFENSVTCYFTKSQFFMCDSTNRQKIQLDASKVQPMKWIHVAISGNKDGETYVQISNAFEVLITKSVQDFYLQQMVTSGWQVCIGDCKSEFGFNGGVREFVFLNEYLTHEEVSRSKNMILTYTPKFKAYYRFNGEDQSFKSDQFVDWSWKQGPTENFMNIDVIPNDICPYTFETQRFVQLNSQQSIIPYELDNTIEQSDYEYSLSMSFYADGSQCSTNSRSVAKSDCNLFYVEELFMVYMYSQNMARIHFFNKKRYSEHQSTLFFVPYNQWLTLQVTVSHFDGYKIVLTDQNGNQFYSKTEERNMRAVIPNKQVQILTGFKGYLESVRFCDEAFDIPIDPESMRDCIIDVKLGGNYESFAGLNIHNYGTSTDSFAFKMQPTPEYRIYQMNTIGSSPQVFYGTPRHEERIFDGIACDDGFMTLQLDNRNSQVQFKTIPLGDWKSQITVEFWFKLLDAASYTADEHIFSFNDRDSRTTYFQIFIKGGQLVCAPFGTQKVGDPTVTFDQFNQANEDDLGWWHISCSYSFQKTVQATLYNEKEVDVTVQDSLIGENTYFPENSLEGEIGKSTNYVPSGVNGIMIKEFRMWTEQRDPEQVARTRNHQLDPQLDDNNKLFHYLRFASANHNHRNFARFNPNFEYGRQEIQVKLRGHSYVSDYSLKETYIYDKNLKQVVAIDEKIHHTVCPLYTYFLDNKCYREPINEMVLAIFPQWSGLQLTYEFSLKYSSLINRNLLSVLNENWWSEGHVVLQSGFERNEFQNAYSRIIGQQYLRNEGKYSVSASLENFQQTFLFDSKINFIPSFCRWFIVKDSDSYSSMQQLDVEPGVEDIYFSLQLQSNPELDCEGFRFYDKFASIEFEFLLTDTANFIDQEPEMRYSLYNPSLDGGMMRAADGSVLEGSSDSVDPRADDLEIRVVLPKNEQTKLPANKDIGILMTIRWTSEEFQQILELEYPSQNPIFQHALYTVKFAPMRNELVTSFIASTTQAIQLEDVILDASGSYVTNLPEPITRRDLTYSWICPQDFAVLCENQTSSKVSLPWRQVVEAGVAFEYPYKFELIITWTQMTGDVTAERMDQTVSWFNAARPEFDIVYQPQPVLVTGAQNTVFSIVPSNFEINNLRMYDVDWTITPELDEPAKRQVINYGQLMEVEKGAFNENTEYIVSVKIQFLSLPVLQASNMISFVTQAPPQGGTVNIQPTEGVLGQPFTILAQGWTSQNSPIVYNVYTTRDANGLTRESLINQSGPLGITEIFQFKITKTTPVQVEVTDSSGEKVIFLLFTRISLDEQWVDPNQEVIPDFIPVTPPSQQPQPQPPVDNNPTVPEPSFDPFENNEQEPTERNTPGSQDQDPVTQNPVQPEPIDQVQPEEPTAATQGPIDSLERERQDLQFLFNQVDQFSDGKLALEEFRAMIVLSAEAANASQEELQEWRNKPDSWYSNAFFEADKDFDGLLSFEEVWQYREEDDGLDIGTPSPEAEDIPVETLSDAERADRLQLRYSFDQADLHPQDDALSYAEFYTMQVLTLQNADLEDRTIEMLISDESLTVMFDNADTNNSAKLSFREIWEYAVLTEGGSILVEMIEQDGQLSPITFSSTTESMELGEVDDAVALLVRLRSASDSATNEKIALMSQIIHGDGSLDEPQLIQIKEDMFDDLLSQIERYSTPTGQYGSNLSTDTYVQEAVVVIQEALHSGHLSYQIIDKAMRALDGLELLVSSQALLASATDRQEFRKEMLYSLEGINKYLRASNTMTEESREWVASHVQKITEKACVDPSVGQSFEYDGEGEIGIMTGTFEKFGTQGDFYVSALDSRYLVTPDTIMDQIPNFTGTLCAQFTSINNFESQDNVYGYSRGVTKFSLIDPVTKKVHNSEELVNQVAVTFAVSPSTYVHNQTVCAARQTENDWQVDTCLTKLQVASYTVQCQCSSFETSEIVLVTDTSRQEGAPMFEFENSLAADQAKNEHQSIAFGFMMCIFIAGLVASVLAIRADKRDWTRLNGVQNEDDQVGLQIEGLLQNVSTVLNEPIQILRARQGDLIRYTSLWNEDRFSLTASKVHPVLSHTGFQLTLSRLMRLSSVLLQHYIVFIITIASFSSNQGQQNDKVFAFSDLDYIFKVAVGMSFLLLPIVSEPCNWAFENKIPRLNESGQIITQNGKVKQVLKALFVVLSQATGLVCCCLTAVWAQETPVTNQYCAVACIILALIFSILGTNMLRVGLNVALAHKRKSSWLCSLFVSAKAEKVQNDIKAVKEAEKMAKKRTYTDMPFEPAAVDHQTSYAGEEELKKENDVSKEYMSESVQCGSQRGLKGLSKPDKKMSQTMHSGIIPSAVDRAVELKTVQTNQTDAKVRYTSCVFNQETR